MLFCCFSARFKVYPRDWTADIQIQSNWKRIQWMYSLYWNRMHQIKYTNQKGLVLRSCTFLSTAFNALTSGSMEFFVLGSHCSKGLFQRFLCITCLSTLQDFNYSIASRKVFAISLCDYVQSSFPQFEVILDHRIKATVPVFVCHLPFWKDSNYDSLEPHCWPVQILF